MKTRQRSLLSAYCGSLLLLTGCHHDHDNTSTANTSPNTNPAVTYAELSGTAATGKAITNTAVTANCKDGTGFKKTVKTNEQGKWSGQVDSSKLPCALEIKTTDGQAYHSYAAAAGNINITPFTDLTIALATSKTPADWFKIYQPIADAQLKKAVADLTGQLTEEHYQLPEHFDLLATEFAIDDTFDKALDAFAAALQASSSSIKDYPALLDLVKAGNISHVPDASLANSGTTVETCADNHLAEVQLNSLSDFQGDYKNQGNTTFSMKVASASAVVNNTQAATIKHACGPTTQSNGTSYLLITDQGKVTLFKDNTGVYSAEGMQFTDPTQTFFGKKDSTVTPTTPTTNQVVLDYSKCDTGLSHCQASVIPDFSTSDLKEATSQATCLVTASNGKLTVTSASATISASFNGELLDNAQPALNYGGSVTKSVRAVDGAPIDTYVQVITKDDKVREVKAITYENFNPTQILSCLSQ